MRDIKLESSNGVGLKLLLEPCWLTDKLLAHCFLVLVRLYIVLCYDCRDAPVQCSSGTYSGLGNDTCNTCTAGFYCPDGEIQVACDTGMCNLRSVYVYVLFQWCIVHCVCSVYCICLP